MSAIDNRDKVYADKNSWLEKYGPILGISLLVVTFVVIAYLSFDFIVKVQSSMLGPMQQIAEGLKSTATSCSAGIRPTVVPPV
jgi:hypothetical protein